MWVRKRGTPHGNVDIPQDHHPWKWRSCDFPVIRADEGNDCTMMKHSGFPRGFL